MLTESCVMFFLPSRAVLSAILQDEYLTSAVRTKEGEISAHSDFRTLNTHRITPYHVWVGVKSSGSGLKSECADIFHQSLISGCYAILTSPKEGETAVYGYTVPLCFEFFRCRVDVLQS